MPSGNRAATGPARAALAAVLSATVLLGGCVVAYDPGSGRSGSMRAGPVTASCGEPALGPAHDAAVEPGSPDQQLLAETLRHRINAVRCGAGVSPLDASPAAATAAREHAEAMSRLAFIGHRSPVRGRETFARRLAAAGAGYRSAGENVARTPLYALGSQQYYVINRKQCHFSRTAGGPAIARSSYRALADTLVDLWMGSADHRANVLNPAYRALGTGFATATGPSDCGDVYAATVFLG